VPVDTFIQTGTWTCPEDVSSVSAECWGAGGGGGGNGGAVAGGGGGGGAYARKAISVIPGTSYTVTVGSGGTGTAGANGGTGGDSWFSTSSTVIAKGGSGGAAAVAGAGGSTGTIGDTTFNGGAGAAGGSGGGGGGAAGEAANGTTATTGTGGAGGSRSGGAGGTGNTNPGGAGAVRGGGGGGGQAVNSAGGAGGRGEVRLVYAPVTNSVRSYDDHKNFPYSTVATAPSPASSGTSLVVASGEGSRFPDTPFNVTVGPANTVLTPANSEIIRVLARSSDTFSTIVRAQEGTSARTVVVGDQVFASVTDRTFTDVEKSVTPPFSELLSFGHSLTTGYGNTSQEYSWPARLAKALGADLEVFGQNGATLSIDDTTATDIYDGGWATIFKRLKPSRTAAPYISAFSAVSFHYGPNDVALFGTGNTVRDSFKGSLRAVIGRARCAAYFEDNHASVTTSGASHASGSGPEEQLSGGQIRYITAADGSYWQIAVPADFPGGAIWIGSLAQGTNGGLASITVDGATPEAINNVAGASTIDNRGLAPGALNLTAHGYRIPISGAGTHTVRITPTTILGGAMYLDWWGIEAQEPPICIVPQWARQPEYSGWSGTPFPPTDATVTTLNGWITDVAAEFSDGKVITPDLDTRLGKQPRHFFTDNSHYNDSGSEVAAAAVLDALRASRLNDPSDVIATAKKGSVETSRAMLKRACRVATVSNISLTAAPATIDGVTMAPFNRVLVKNQTTASQNGIYRWLRSGVPMERETDFDSSQEIISGCMVWVVEGTVQNSRTLWGVANTDATIIPDTTAIRWMRVSPDVMLQPQRSVWTPGSNAIETVPRVQAATNLAVLSSGRLTLVGGIVIPAGQTVTSISVLSGTQAAVSPTNKLFGIFRQSDRALLRATTNDTNVAWAQNTVKTINLTATYTPDEDMPIYIGIMVTAGTVPSLTVANNTVAANTIVPILQGTSTTGLTTSLPNPAAAITAAAGVPYAYLT
jgi:hypothetical protein